MPGYPRELLDSATSGTAGSRDDLTTAVDRSWTDQFKGERRGV
jgi:hypothetical protein